MSSLYALILVDRPTTKQKAIVCIWNTEYMEYWNTGTLLGGLIASLLSKQRRGLPPPVNQ
jgi:hypothetical protein